jgi:hypothetical protein
MVDSIEYIEPVQIGVPHGLRIGVHLVILLVLIVLHHHQRSRILITRVSFKEHIGLRLLAELDMLIRNEALRGLLLSPPYSSKKVFIVVLRGSYASACLTACWG